MFATFLLGVLIFVDDYFNCLTVGSVMRPVTDSHHVSRAKLAYLIDATAGRYDIASLFAVYFHTQLAAPTHLDPGAFDLLGDVRAAETAFHIYTSAVSALYEELLPPPSA